MSRHTRRWGWVDDDAALRQAHEQADAREKRAQAEADARRQADAPETIPPTGKHHRADGQ